MIFVHPTRSALDGTKNRMPIFGAQTHTFRTDSTASVSPAGIGVPQNALTPETYEAWVVSGFNLIVDLILEFSEPLTVDYAAMGAFHALRRDLLSPQNVSLTIETSGDGGTSWDDLTNGSVTVSGRKSAVIALGTSRLANRVRFSFSLPFGGASIRVPVAYAGLATRSERPVYQGHSPMLLNRDTVTINRLSSGGAFLGQRIRRQGVTGDITIRNLSPDFVRNEMDPALEHMRAAPFFFAWRPSDYPQDAVYAWRDGRESVENSGPRDLMQISIPMRAYDDRSPFR